MFEKFLTRGCLAACMCNMAWPQAQQSVSACLQAGALSPQGVPAAVQAAQILEALWAAGYRPTVYCVPDISAELDPFALLEAAPRQLHVFGRLVLLGCFANNDFRSPAGQRLLFLARTGGAWSPAVHHHWPEAFKGAARTLLLCAAAGSRLEGKLDASQPAPLACLLGSLPQDALLLVLKHAAEPLSTWMARG